MAIECEHPRPPLDLPGYTAKRMAWQAPAYIPGLPPDAARVVRDAFQGVYNELGKLGLTRNVIPLYEDILARPGAVIQGVGNGQTITLATPGATGYLDPVTVLLTDVTSPVKVVHPDGTVTELGGEGAYTFEPAGDDAYATDALSAILAGGVPTDVLLGRDSAGTGAVEFITVTAPIEFDGAGAIRLTPMAADTFLGRLAGSGAPATQQLSDIDSTSIVYDATSHSFQSAAKTGDVTASQNSNTFAFRSFSALSVLARAANSSGIPTELAAGANDRVLARSSDSLAFQQVSAGMIADAAVTNAKLADMAAGTVKGRQIDAVTGVPVDLTGLEVGEIIRFGTTQTHGTAGSNQTITLNADTTLLVTNTSNGSIDAITGGVSGRVLFIRHTSGGATTTSINHDAGGTDGVLCPGGVPFVYGGAFGGTSPIAAVLIYNSDSARWVLFPRGLSRGEDVTWTGSHTHTGATHTVSTTGDVDINAGDDLRMNGVAGAAVSALAAGLPTAPATGTLDLRADSSIRLITNGTERLEIEDDGAWQLGGSTGTLGHTIVNAGASAPPAWGQVPTAGLTDDSVTDAKLRNSAALSVIGRSANSSGDPADISTTSSSAAVLRESGGVLGFGTIATGGIADDAVTDAKLRESAALSVIGRAANSTGNPADISAGTDGHVLRRSGTTLGFGTVATAGLADSSVTPIKLAPGVHTLAAGTHNDVAIADTVTTILLTGDATITGIAGGWNGRILEVIVGAFTLTLAFNSGSSTAGNRIATPGGIDYVALRGGATLVYDTQPATDIWRASATAGAGDASITLAKMANLAESRIIGRAESAGTGVPTALSPTQVVSIIDGESPTWTASHRFDSHIQFGTPTGLPASGDIRKAGALEIRGASTIDLTASNNAITLTSGAAITLDAATDIVLDGADDILATATDAITIQAGGILDMSGSTSAELTSAGDITVDSGDTLSLVGASSAGLSSGGDVLMQSVGNLFLEAGTFVRINGGVRRIGRLDNTTNGTINNLAIGHVGVVRFTNADILTGMVPSADWQEVWIINASPSGDLLVAFDSASSSSANQFAGFGTSRIIRQEDPAMAIYDGTSAKWRLLAGRD